MKKVKIIKAPTQPSYNLRSGDQVNYGLYTGSFDTYNVNDYSKDNSNIRGSYPQVDRDEANIEVEQGEIIVNQDLSAIYNLGGKKHSKGGTPIKAKEGSYIVSDYIKVNPDIAELLGFDLGKKDKKKTWAELLKSTIDAKTYNSYNAILKDKSENKNVDLYEYNTAKNKIDDLKTQVSKIILGNELSKAIQGKDYNIPQSSALAMEQIQNQQNFEDEPLVEAKDGMYLPKYQQQGLYPIPPSIPDYANVSGIIQGANIANKYKWYKPFTASNTKQGQFSKNTGANTLFTGKNNSVYNDIDYWEKQYGKPFGSTKEMQGFVFNKLKSEYPEKYNEIINRWGLPSAGRLDDGFAGIRTEEGLKFRIPDKISTKKEDVVVPSVNTDTKKEDSYTNPGPSDNTVQTKKAPNNVGYDSLDQLSLLESMKRNPTRYPKTFIPDYQQYNPQLEDPNYYPILSAQRTRAELTNQFANPQIARNTLSFQPDLIQGILGENQRVGANNLQTVNQAKQYNSANYNNYANIVAGLRTQDYDKVVKTLDNRDTERKLQNNDMLGAVGNMRSNRDQMRAYLAQYPQFGLTNPNDYSSVPGFLGGSGNTWDTPGGQQPTMEEALVKARTMLQGINPETIPYFIDMLKMMGFGNNERVGQTTITTRNPRRTMTTRQPGVQSHQTTFVQ